MCASWAISLNRRWWFLLLWVPLGLKAEDVAHWLERMDQALDSLNYRGIFVFLQGQRLEAMEWIRSVEDGREREHLFALTGPEREMIKDGGVITCIFPRDMLRVEGPKRLAFRHLSGRLEDLRRFYDFSLPFEDRVAGRPAQVLQITPKDAFRFGHRLWLDREHGLILRSQVLDRQGHIHEQLMFTSVAFLPQVGDALFRPFLKGRRLVMREKEQGPGIRKPSPWKVTWLPAGFAPVSQRMRRSPAGTWREQRVFSDGLAAVSVFIEAAEAPRRLGPSSVGAIRTYRRYADGHLITVVGEVPEVTVRRIAESIRRD